MHAQEIDKHTWLITRGEGQASIHTYLLEGKDKAAIIDTGLEPEELREFTERYTDKPLIVLHTHGHIDHIGNDQQFDEVMLHPADFALYRLHSSGTYRKNFFQAQYESIKQYDPFEAKRYAEVHNYTLNQDVHLIPLVDGMTIDLGNRYVKVIENPGHTQGCVSFFEEARSFIFTGDMVCELGVLMHFPEATSMKTYKASLHKIRSSMTDTFKLFAGHQSTPLGIDWVDQYIVCAEDLINLGKSMIKDDPSVQGDDQVSIYVKDSATISYASRQLSLAFDEGKKQ